MFLPVPYFRFYEGSLDIDELQESEKGIIINAIPSSSKILVLKPQLDKDGLLRSCGKLQNANYLSYDVRYPIILPRRHIVTKPIIKQHHENNHHALGTNQLLAKFSARFWTASAREGI